MGATPQILHIRESSGVSRQIPLDGRAVTIGRDADCSISLDSPFVSRHHARIEVRDGVPVLVDLGSRNGSALNGERVEGVAPLRVGDVIAIADVTIECLPEQAQGLETRTYAMDAAAAAARPAQEPHAASGEGQTAQPEAPDTLRVDPNLFTVYIGGREIERRLSALEFALLSHLYVSRDRVCTREELGDAVWGPGKWEVNMLHRLVHRLKDKIEPAAGAGQTPRYIHSVPWIGYRLTP